MCLIPEVESTGCDINPHRCNGAHAGHTVSLSFSVSLAAGSVVYTLCVFVF